LCLSLGACIAPSVIDVEDRAARLDLAQVEWRDARESDVAGTYVSMELSGPLASVLRMVVYLFEADGGYTGAGLVDDDPPHFEVIRGSWRLAEGRLSLDDAPPASLHVAPDGSLRLAGPDGAVVLRREATR
jgi:hypothetical protein